MDAVYIDRLEDNLQTRDAIDMVFNMDDFVQAITTATPSSVDGSDECVGTNPVPEMLQVLLLLLNLFF